MMVNKKVKIICAFMLILEVGYFVFSVGKKQNNYSKNNNIIIVLFFIMNGISAESFNCSAGGYLHLS